MILLISTSVDQTTDLLMEHLPNDEVFRFNADLLCAYTLAFTPKHFRILDPAGRKLEPGDVSACYFRKLNYEKKPDIPAGGSVESWLQQTQTAYAKELYDWFRGTDRMVMELGAGFPLGKIGQMNLASRFFKVPDWFAGVSPEIHQLPFARHCVNKNLSNAFISDYKGHLVTKVHADELDPTYPWFLQQLVAAQTDVTVVYLNGKCFAYECPRDEANVDCRVPEKFYQWKPCRLAAEEEQAVISFMRDARLHFGRLDLLRDADGGLWFLEVNTNGQWGWLDLKGDSGLFKAVANEILAVHRRHSGS